MYLQGFNTVRSLWCHVATPSESSVTSRNVHTTMLTSRGKSWLLLKFIIKLLLLLFRFVIDILSCCY